MSLQKQTIIDQAQTIKVADHYCIQIRERNQILEDGQEISASFHRYVLQPDHDVSTIKDETVLAQFNAVMTDDIKSNYQTFLESQNQPEDTEE